MNTLHTTHRRRLAVIGTVLSAALILTGCSTNADGTNATTQGGTESSLLPAAEGTTQYPLTLETPWGETVLEERPERITLSGIGEEIELLAILNVNPIGATSDVSDPEDSILPWAVELLDVPVETTWEWDYESPDNTEIIAKSNPDLIIADDTTTKDIYDKLSTIAPVLYIGEEEATWQQKIVEIGETLDLTEAAEKTIPADEKYWQDLRTQYPQFEGKILTNFVVWGGEYGAAINNTPGSVGEKYFTQWGFNTNPQLVRFENTKEISAELIDLLDADLIIGYDLSQGEFDQIVSSPLFTNLSAVKNGTYIEIKEREDGTYANNEPLEFEGHLGKALAGITGPLGAQYAAEKMAPILAEALSK